MPDSSEHVPVIAVASGPGAGQHLGPDPEAGQHPVQPPGRAGCRQGTPVLITGAVPEQVAAFELIAGQVTGRLTGR